MTQPARNILSLKERDENFSKALGIVRCMVTQHARVRLSRSCSHVPEIFFKEVLTLPQTYFSNEKTGEGYRVKYGNAVALAAYSHILIAQSRRDLVIPHDEKAYEALVSRKIVRARQFVQTMLDTSYVIGGLGFTVSELTDFLLRWLILDWMGLSCKQKKLHDVWLSGYSRGVDAPTTGMLDKPGFLLNRRHHVWVLRQLRNKRILCSPHLAGAKYVGSPFSVSEYLGETLLMGEKRGCPSLEDVDEKTEAKAYQQKMATPVEITGPYREHIIASLKESTLEVFGEFVSMVPVDPFVSSMNAGFEAPRWLGGILGARVRTDPELLSERYEIGWASDGSVATVTSARAFDFEKAYYDTVREWRGGDELADCKIYMIREPLKLRTITAGSPSLYGGLQPILDHLRKGMARFDCFKLTRSENNAAWLSERLNRTLGRIEVVDPITRRVLKRDTRGLFRLLLSGDYQQSTNDLSMRVTTVVREFAFDGELMQVVKKALGAQRLWYDEESVLQENGQLMGSPLSFPVLCVANAALIRLAYQLAYNRWWGLPLDCFPIAINGDDILARVDLRVYDIWTQLLSAVGWKLSPGKSYLHETLAQVNSQTMHVYWVKDRVVLSDPIPFINHGFIAQMGKACKQIDEAPLDAMSFDWQRRWKSMERLPAAWCRRSREVMMRNLKKMCHRLYVAGLTPYEMKPSNPVRLGGLGCGAESVDFDVVWKALNCIPAKVESFEEKLAKDPRNDIAEKNVPYFTWAKPSGAKLRPPRSGEVLESLMNDLERYVEAQTRLELVAPEGHVDPEYTRINACGRLGVWVNPRVLEKERAAGRLAAIECNPITQLLTLLVPYNGLVLPTNNALEAIAG
jgi:hypothetical protein